jgi:hypothetical protein
MKITGFMPAYNVLSGQYPFLEMIALALPLVDEFIFNDGGSDDGTLEVIKEAQKYNKKIKIFEYPHNKSRESYKGMDIAIEEVLKLIDDNNWVIEFQADEYYPVVFHDLILKTIKKLNTLNYSSIRHARPTVCYFDYRNIFDDNHYRHVRIFKNSKGKIKSESGGDDFTYLERDNSDKLFSSHLPPEHDDFSFFGINLTALFIIDEFIRQQRHCNFYDSGRSDGSRYDIFKGNAERFSLGEFEELDYKNLKKYDHLDWSLEWLHAHKDVLIQNSKNSLRKNYEYCHPMLISLLKQDYYQIRNEVFDYIKDENKIYDFTKAKTPRKKFF